MSPKGGGINYGLHDIFPKEEKRTIIQMQRKRILNSVRDDFFFRFFSLIKFANVIFTVLVKADERLFFKHCQIFVICLPADSCWRL